ncbi:hypothetical protein [Phenylobacterium sp. Root700]|uniref:terminase small subunit-like protein n=1 Tax=Phenylobacterium sp. Root700 TaxID=1736591 RepID=UPI0012E33FA3|nr:hypothetical protein [Phenylobacterium sp. Root700]
MSDGNLPARAGLDDGAVSSEGGPRAWRRFSEGLGSVICARVAAGESLMQICADDDMPSRAAVVAWGRGWRRRGPRRRAIPTGGGGRPFADMWRG